jgi:hypothetical protein
MKSVYQLAEVAPPTFLDARFHEHDVIPAQAGIQESAQILDINQFFTDCTPV